MESDSQPVSYSGLPGLRFDHQGMLLPHSVLGSLEDFRGYLQAKGETELVKRIPESVSEPLSEITGRLCSEAAGQENPPEQRHRETNALHHWDTHMRQRRRQQSTLSDLLDRPVENLLMNQDDHYRETQEERELLNRALPLIQSGYGYRVGSEFWSLPQHYGDELSGITATLTQAELGRRKAVTHVGLPNSLRQETGLRCGETSQTRSQRSYLLHQIEELREVLRDHDVKKPDISGLEVIGSRSTSSFATACQRRSVEMEEKEKEHKESKNEILDPPTEKTDLQSDALSGPALRFCGQLATWTGNSPTNQGETGIRGTIVFETSTGEVATSHLELQNEGSTVLFFNWQKVPVKHSFACLPSRKKKQHFHFNSLPGVIRPGDTKRVEFVFKSEEPGIETELWQLNTHPLLLQGASMQVTLRGVALHQDKTADQRLFLETKLEKLVVLRTCQSIVDEVLQGVRSPERPSSPADLYVTEEQMFASKNPKLQFLHQPVHSLKRLWQEATQGLTWDLSVDTLRQAVLSLPDEEPSERVVTREQSLAQLNSMLLQLSESSEVKQQHLTAVTAVQPLMRTLLDMVSIEAMQLRSLLGLPQSEMWTDRNDESTTSDADLADNTNRDEESKKRSESTAGERSGARSRVKEFKSLSAEKSLEESKKHGRSRDDLWKSSREKQGKESGSESSIEPSSDEPPGSSETKLLYTRLLHTKVYALMEDFVDSLCDLVDEVNMGDEQETHIRQ